MVLPAASRANERWSMDFVSDCLDGGRKFRALTIVDDFNASDTSCTASRPYPPAEYGYVACIESSRNNRSAEQITRIKVISHRT